jgi:hypothetical protein
MTHVFFRHQAAMVAESSTFNVLPDLAGNSE